MCWRISLVALALTGCFSPGAVEWASESERLPANEQGILELDAQGHARLAAPAREVRAPRPLNLCPGSLRMTGFGSTWYAVWWSRRTNGVDLSVGKTVDSGRTWAPPLIADGMDRGTLGCTRPAPAIAFDTVTGNVHLAYYSEPADGAGIFFVHSMDHGGMFHSPVAVLYGTRPVAAAVAGVADTVIVAYEDPNSSPQAIGVAISRTTGHIFEERQQLSGVNVAATAPQVALRMPHVAVGWREDNAFVVRGGTMHR